MNPAAAATGSSGLAGAAVVLINAILSHWGLNPSSDVIAAEVTVLTSLAGVGAHYLTRVLPPAATIPELKP